ncbi:MULTISPECIES: DNA repair protein RecN [Pediococcus]|jgi:DNA repair protein RecN (Recombination protein N)|uniref:DNA repair protein RecN n=1 Tax=Pediococcus parvulus TaxID=54062 RepID=A0A176TJG1_9LACO|nr:MULTISPECIES: DNA repair protein RecN [Pediococcus]MCT3026333.1 DNA repair protein RecN [Pediococcus parvulus]MCT3028417.1 DNA repair protein RecN [Pediococcus parvulus]MDN5574775.1 DNA repair protein RecN [Pediococcus sp.]MDV7693328.1 DNA repair protein RecN [Pediococcus parvulus]OAD63672.1 DNA repair protein RecN [Pediococcus parvulus]
MLQELSIRNFAIIEKLNIEFNSGMTVLTGETGAGKSIIIDAVGLLAGGRGSVDFIRKGTKKAVLQGMFSMDKNPDTLALLDQYGIEHADPTLILQREIQASGRNVCRINGSLVNTTILKKIGETLIDIHGQNEHQELMQPEKHLGMLDEFARNGIQPLLKQYQQKYEHFQNLKQKFNRKKANEKEWAQRVDMLRFQVKEIEDANLQVGEEEQLNSQKELLENFQKISTALQTAQLALENEESAGAIDSTGEAMNALRDIENIDDKYKNISNIISSAYYQLQDATSDISGELENMEWDEGKLDQVEKRLEEIYQLKKKYGDNIQQILAYDQKASEELHSMVDSESDEDQMESQLETIQEQLKKIALQLSTTRKQAASKLQVAVHDQLKQLYMDKAEFEVHFDESAGLKFKSTGIDNVEFYLRTNPGESMGPLSRIASGGELSRIMLALKTIFAKSQGVTSIIFDEVDTGVSGRVAQAIAEKIKLIASYSQVLCITHLPQVAAEADHQFFVSKAVKGGRTETKLSDLNENGRVQELARMLAGSTVTKLSIQHAKELLKMAHTS